MNNWFAEAIKYLPEYQFVDLQRIVALEIDRRHAMQKKLEQIRVDLEEWNREKEKAP